MSLEISLKEAAALLSSDRATERKKNAEALKSFINGNSAPVVLSENQKRHSGFSWDDLFEAVHNFALKETEKFDTSKSFHNIRVLCTSLLLTSVSSAINYKAYIKCDRLVDSCTFVLQRGRLTRALGDIYLNLLHKHVLACEHYVENILPKKYEEILNAIIAISASTSVDRLTCFRVLEQVITSCTKYCHSATLLRDIYLDIAKLHHGVDNKLLEVLIKIDLTVMETLAVEARYTMCEFAETIIPTLLRHYDVKNDHSRKSDLFACLEIAIRTHYPDGIKIDVTASHLMSIFELVMSEADRLEKIFSETRFKGPNSAVICDRFVELAVRTLQEVILLSSTLDLESDGPAPKRIKLENSETFKSFQDMLVFLKRSPFPWLKIIDKYTEIFPNELSTKAKIDLLQALEGCISTGKCDWQSLSNVTCRLLVQCENTDSRWETLFSCCSRNSVSQNVSHKYLHDILQTLIHVGCVDKKMTSQLLKLYFDKAMPVTNASLATLTKLLGRKQSKIKDIHTKEKILEWVSKDFGNNCDDLKCLAELLLHLSTKETLAIREKKEATNNIIDDLFDKVDDNILVTNFLKNPWINKDVTNGKNEEFSSYVTFCSTTKVNVELLLIEKISEIISDDEYICNEKYLNYVEITLRYLDMQLKYDLIKETDLKTYKLFALLKRAIKTIFSLLPKRISDEAESFAKRKNIVRILSTWLMYDYEEIISTSIRCFLEEDFFRVLYEVIHKEANALKNNSDMFLGTMEQSEDGLRPISIQFLSAYCVVEASFRRDILEFVFEPSLFDLNSKGDLEIIFDCLNVFIRCKIKCLPLERMFQLIQFLCKSSFRVPWVVEHLLLIMRRLLPSIVESNIETVLTNTVTILRGFLERCSKGCYTPKIYAILLDCLTYIEINCEKMARISNRNFKSAIVDSTKHSNNNVRLFSCYCVARLANKGTLNQVDTFLDNLFDIFDVDMSTISENIIKDEYVNRSATSLHSIFLISQQLPATLPKTLSTVVQLIKSKSLNIKTAKNMLNFLSKEFGFDSCKSIINKHFLFIVNHWFYKRLNVSDFPFVLLDFSNFDQFLVRMVEVLVPFEAFWYGGGNLKKSVLISRLKNDIKMDDDLIKDRIFATTMILTLPTIAKEKYDIDDSHWRPKTENIQRAKALFTSLAQYIGNENLGDYFLKHFGDLFLVLTRNLNFEKRLEESNVYQFSVPVYKAILDYFGEMVQAPIITQLCRDSPLKIHEILLSLWSDIEEEKITENKLSALEKYMTFYESIPDKTHMDEYINSFVCTSLLHTLKGNIMNKHLAEVLCKYLHRILVKLLPDHIEQVSNTIPQLVEVLNGNLTENGSERDRLKSFICVDMEYVTQRGTDAVDFNRNGAVVAGDSNVLELEKMVLALKTKSYQNLVELQDFLRRNKSTLLKCWRTLEHTNGFSELCSKSVLHKAIYALTNIVCESKDRKCITIACQCLGEIGPCDLRTIVLMTPKDPQHLLDLKPTLYTTLVAAKMAAEYVCDSSPNAVRLAGELLKTLLSYDEGRSILDLGYIPVRKEKLLPFLSIHSRPKKLKGSIIDEEFSKVMDLNPFVYKESEPFSKWVVRVNRHISRVFDVEHNYLSQLNDLCSIKYQMAGEVLPALMGLLIHWSNDSQVKVISLKVNQFFRTLFTDETSCNADEPMKADKAIVQCMLNVVDFVRLQCVQYKNRPRDENDMYNYLKLDYTRVSRAACACGAAVYGILYAELARNQDALSLLTQCHKSLGENDAIEDESASLSSAELLFESLLSQESTRHDRWGSTSRQLCKAGLFSLAARQPVCDRTKDLLAHCYARLGDWTHIMDTEVILDDMNNRNDHQKLITNFEIQKYTALKEIMTNTKLQPELWQTMMDQARLNIATMLKLSNRENCRNIYESMYKLQMLEEINVFYETMRDNNYEDLLSRWDVENLLPVDRIEYREPILWQRGTLLNKCYELLPALKEDIMLLQLKYAEIAVDSNIRSWSERAVRWCTQPLQQNADSTFNIEDLTLRSQHDISLGQAWSSKGLLLLARERHAAGFSKTAISICRKVLSTDDRLIRAEALRQLGVWISESRSENSKDILEQYLLKSEKTLPSNTSHVEALKVYLEIAKFADAEYKRVDEYMKSSIFENKIKCLNSMKGTADSFKQSQSSATMSRDERAALNFNERFSKLDEADIMNTYEEKDQYLQLALKYYLMFLRGCTQSEPGAVWRVAALWTAGGKADGIQHVPSYKLLPVLPQLIPRLTVNDDPFSSQLNKLVERCCLEHPQHALPLILAQHNSHADMCPPSSSLSRSGKSEVEPRIKAASRLVESLMKRNIGPIVKQMEELSLALISLANYQISTDKKAPKQNIPRSEALYKLKNLNRVMVPTVTLPVNVNGCYEDIVSVVNFSHVYSLVGGINAPKKLSCLGSDGIERPILLKGQDDLRQDAVMQQVFMIVNSLFQKDNNSLMLRTYKVVPLSRRSGVLEWCEGSIPIGLYLIEAHKKYRPQDISPELARTMIHKCKATKEDKLNVFKKILEGFKPVFRHFFLEHFHSPVVWYERRRAYTNSVATTSMVGYILGIGDRHVQNILLDKQTAQVIHIDFGIAFELGKALPTPETVPFRLTQDIVDGFGISGTKGLFKKSCEKSLQLLRDNCETLLTILEVLLYDPLYSWSVLPDKNRGENYKITGREPVVAGQAGRALVVLAGKLLERMSVSGHVASLLQRATDPANLASLYSGWQPYL